MHEDLSGFILSTAISLLSALICVMSILFWRIVRRRPLLQINRNKRIESPGVIYIGAILCGVSSLGAFLAGRPYTGFSFLLMLIFFVLGLIAQKKGII
jgi:hypothetical protein